MGDLSGRLGVEPWPVADGGARVGFDRAPRFERKSVPTSVARSNHRCARCWQSTGHAGHGDRRTGGLDRAIMWFGDHVRPLCPGHRRRDPADRLMWAAGDAEQCDLWFPPRKIALEDGTRVLLPVLVITAG